MDDLYLNLQLFADGEGGDAGVSASDAGVQDTAQQSIQPGRKQRKANPLANVQYGVQPQAQTAQQTTETQEPEAEPTFDELIKGKYKDEYGRAVQGVIRERFKANAETEERLNSLNPLLEALGQKYNVDPTDVDKLTAVITDDDSLYENEAIERGISVETLKSIKQMERENEILRQRDERTQQEMQMRAHFDNLARQADEAKQYYPSLDLMTEMNNPTFARLTAPGVGVDVRTAYEVVHRDEMRGTEMQVAAQKSAERMAKAIQSGSMRPGENGISSQQGGAPIKTDPRTLTKADREEIHRRVRNGEKIVF